MAKGGPGKAGGVHEGDMAKGRWGGKDSLLEGYFPAAAGVVEVDGTVETGLPETGPLLEACAAEVCCAVPLRFFEGGDALEESVTKIGILAEIRALEIGVSGEVGVGKGGGREASFDKGGGLLELIVGKISGPGEYGFFEAGVFARGALAECQAAVKTRVQCRKAAVELHFFELRLGVEYDAIEGYFSEEYDIGEGQAGPYGVEVSGGGEERPVDGDVAVFELVRRRCPPQ